MGGCTEYTPVEQNRHKKQTNDQWRLLQSKPIQRTNVVNIVGFELVKRAKWDKFIFQRVLRFNVFK